MLCVARLSDKKSKENPQFTVLSKICHTFFSLVRYDGIKGW